MRRLIIVGILAALLAVVATAAAQDETTPSPAENTVSALPRDVVALLINARTDLEVLANSQLGDERPIGWSGSLDISSADLALLLRLDLELLVSRLLGVDQRPSGWFGAVPSTASAIARDIRHDLELLADTVVQPNVRPPGWTGADPLMRCDRATQNLIELLRLTAQFILLADPNSADYCQRATVLASQFTEQRLGSSSSAGENGAALVSGSIEPNGSATLAFLDRNARQSVGLIPTEIRFVPLARSYAQFSNMVLVRGDDFEVFVDYKTTTLTDEAFEALDNVDSLTVTPACAADWCAPAG